MCTRAIYLKKGEVRFEGDVEKVFEVYKSDKEKSKSKGKEKKK